MKEHTLKTWTGFFDAIIDGTKRFEMRFDDREYQVGDALHLREFDPDEPDAEKAYTKREARFRVTYILAGREWGIAPGWVVMSIERAAPVYLPNGGAE